MAQNSIPDDAAHPKPEDEGTIFLQRSSIAAPAGRTRHRSDEIQVGDTIKDRFVVEELLGVGGMGKVYLAVDLRKKELSDRNPYVALKLLKEVLRDHPLSIMAMQREARKAQELAHPNIIKVYDFDRDGDQYYITMEYLVGQSLDRVIRSPDFKPRPVVQALPIINEVGAALSFAHSNGFVHCDLKPGNIFIAQSGRVKVIDFGIARAIKTGLAGTEDATVFSPEDLAALTPAYASPQMIELQAPQPSDDVFALACIAYELMSGQHPFRRVPATHARDSGMKPKRLKDLTNSQWQAITRALAFDTRERTPTVAAFLEELNQSDLRTRGPFGRVAILVGLCAGCGAIGFVLVALWAGGALTPAAPIGEGTAAPSPQNTVSPASPALEQPAMARSTAEPPAKSIPTPSPPTPPPLVSPSAGRLPPAPPVEAPGALEARSAFGSWCGDSFQMMFGPMEGSLKLPSGAEMRLRVERYVMAAGRLAIHTVAPDGARSVWEFGGISSDGKSMVHLRLQSGGGEWRTYNRRLRRC